MSERSFHSSSLGSNFKEEDHPVPIAASPTTIPGCGRDREVSKIQSGVVITKLDPEKSGKEVFFVKEVSVDALIDFWARAPRPVFTRESIKDFEASEDGILVVPFGCLKSGTLDIVTKVGTVVAVDPYGDKLGAAESFGKRVGAQTFHLLVKGPRPRTILTSFRAECYAALALPFLDVRGAAPTLEEEFKFDESIDKKEVNTLDSCLDNRTKFVIISPTLSGPFPGPVKEEGKPTRVAEFRSVDSIVCLDRSLSARRFSEILFFGMSAKIDHIVLVNPRLSFSSEPFICPLSFAPRSLKVYISRKETARGLRSIASALPFGKVYIVLTGRSGAFTIEHQEIIRCIEEIVLLSKRMKKLIVEVDQGSSFRKGKYDVLLDTLRTQTHLKWHFSCGLLDIFHPPLSSAGSSTI